MCALPSDSELKGRDSPGLAALFLLEPVREFTREVERDPQLVGYWLWRWMDELHWHPDHMRRWLHCSRHQWWPLFLSALPRTEGHIILLCAVYQLHKGHFTELLDYCGHDRRPQDDERRMDELLAGT